MFAIYARQSVDRKDSISIETQIEYCLCEVHGEEQKTYEDKGYSGKNTSRPAFQEMINDIKHGKIEKVIVYKLDRISRSVLDFSNMMELFQLYKVEFVSCNEKFDTATPMGRAMLNICIVFAQLERETIQLRVKDAYQSMSEKGYYMGGRVPFGFQRIPHQLDGIKTSQFEIYEEEAKQVRDIYSIYKEPAASYGDILNYFKERGILHHGKPWTRARIADILKNPVYVKADVTVYDFFKSQGTLIFNPREDFVGINGCYYYSGEDAGRKYADLNGQKLVLAPHQGIIEADEWLKCRKKALQNKQVQPGRKVLNTWLAGLVKCGVCGYALTFKKYKTRRARYLLCSNKYNSKACKGAGTIYADEFEDKIYHEMLHKLSEFQTVSDKSKAVKKNPKLTALYAELEKYGQEIDSLMNKLASADDILMAYISKKIKELDTRKKEVEKEIAEYEIEQVDTKHIIKIENGLKNWQELSIEDRRQIAIIMIKRISATSQKTVIDWKI